MPLLTSSYAAQNAAWPTTGRHILAQFDEESVVVYQAYLPAIGHYAAEHGQFGGDFSYGRMSWIKTNFLWMMYRSGWGTKPAQEVTLAVRLKRAFFDDLLAQAVPSTYQSTLYSSPEVWKLDLGRSQVRLQWDPDHGPKGQPLERRAIQLGMRGSVLEEYGRRAILGIDDISNFVAEQRLIVQAGDLKQLMTPAEAVYLPADPVISPRLGLAL
jgi:hypothetical protein